MCGITGFFDFTKTSSELILEKMSNTLFHRGPDGGDTLLFNESNVQIGFGHRRLSIIDLSEHGKQPMQFENLTICYNGEIYNYQEIKAGTFSSWTSLHWWIRHRNDIACLFSMGRKLST